MCTVKPYDEYQRIEVAWCIKVLSFSLSRGFVLSLSPQPGYGTRLIPDGAIKGAHFVQTPDFVQITGKYSSFIVPARISLISYQVSVN